ncbi:MAG: tRNA pseudouridine(55) synthase TruB [Zoogloeaceae bacterium]|jgi:tRNA pseudouridine55 synthase|nr:tRNA pseudouridine(55) synthase TruB [Zoogloeaceae bacterium]
MKDIPPKKRWQAVHGVLLLDKPGGMTSNAALQKARRLFSAAKAGHTGTLDPMATGLLPLCFGAATRFSADILRADKTYEAEICFGAMTDTGDREGQITRRAALPPDLADRIAGLLARFTGEQLQTPPMYSALKHNGRPLYELARQGVTVERAPRRVVFYALEPLSWASPRLSLRVKCSKGAYIRTLAGDLGQAADCGAHLTALRRVQVGALELRRAHTLEVLESLSENERLACIDAVDSLLATLPAIRLNTEAASRFLHGNPVPGVRAQAPDADGDVRVYQEHEQEGAQIFLGQGYFKPDGSLCPRRVKPVP